VLTAELHASTGARLTVGVEASAAMRRQAPALAGWAVARADLAAVRPRRRADVVLSNAALHWVDDHERLIPALLDLVRAGGRLAFQVPSNDAHPSHRIAAEVAEEEPFATALEGFVRRTPVLEPADYAALLRAAGAVEVRAEARVFEHELESPAAVVTWVRGTTLTAYERRLAPELYARYLERYTERLLAELGGGEADGAPFRYPFRRTFVWAVR
jgi:trans-aconitate 2-methyltransferase